MQLSHQLTSKESILAIIITFNPDLIHFSNFITKLSNQFSKILIIDNDSKNYKDITHCVESLKASCEINFIKNLSNIGLASAQNQGAKFVIENSYEAFCIFDQDSDIDTNYLDVMVADYNTLVSRGESVGTIGPCIVDRSTGLSYPVTIYNGVLLNRYTLKGNEIAECSFIISSGSLIPRGSLTEVGLFLDILFINYIDIEWCFRSRFKGLKVFTSNNTKLTQDVGLYRKMILGRSIPVHNPIRRYYAARNSIFMLFLPHVSIGYKLREIFFNPMRLVFDCLVEGNTRHRVSFFMKGIYDGIRGK